MSQRNGFCTFSVLIMWWERSQHNMVCSERPEGQQPDVLFSLTFPTMRGIMDWGNILAKLVWGLNWHEYSEIALLTYANVTVLSLGSSRIFWLNLHSKFLFEVFCYQNHCISDYVEEQEARASCFTILLLSLPLITLFQM